LNPTSAKNQGEVRDQITDDFLQQGGVMNDIVESEINRIVTDPSQYIDWSIPWTVTFGYNLAYNKQTNGNKNITQALTISGDVSISDK
jgi:hypothetical protein